MGITSSPQESRIYPSIAPDGAAYPLIEYTVISDAPISTVAGTNDMHRMRIQLSCYGLEHDYDGAKALADAVVAALEGTGYQEFRIDLYDPATKRHGVHVDWSYLYP